MKKNILYILSLVGLLTISSEVTAQQLRTSYFMENSIMRRNMNPALLPERGYINIPFIGAIGIEYHTNSLTMNNLFYHRDNKLVTFLDKSVDAKKFLSNIKSNNRLNADVATNIIGFGFYSNESFWTFDFNMKSSSTTNIPKELFEFAKIGSTNDITSYDIYNTNLNMQAYTDIAVGYSRKINNRLTVGGKVKLIMGFADMDMSIDHLRVRINEDIWAVEAKGSINGSLAGAKPKYETDSNGRYFSDIDIDDFGVAGYGLGIDLGATYKLTPNLTLSAALIDLGFISWGEKDRISGINATNYNFSGFEIGDDDPSTDSPESDFSELIRFREVKAESSTTSLRTTINVGGEYAFFNNKLSAGLLSSTRVRANDTMTELTVSANWRPLSWLTATLSYSFMNSNFETFGCALNLSPSWINVFIGTDYILGRVTPQFVPINNKSANVYFGIGIPLAKRGK